MSLSWTEQLSVGNSVIDSDHKILMGMINGIELALKARDVSRLAQAFERLDSYASVHFKNEEMVAQAVNFPFAQHKRAHQYLQQELLYLKAELDAFEGGWSDRAAEHFTGFLRDWLIRHVTSEDALMKPVLQTYPYEFRPS